MTELKPVTLENLHQRTLQQIFDWVVYSLLNQGEQCSDDEFGCMYHNEDLRCAAGHCISDKEYHELQSKLVGDKKFIHGIENKPISRVIAKSNEVLGTVVPDETRMRLMQSLQEVHDRLYVSCWVSEFNRIAEEFGFDTIILDHFEELENEQV